MDPFNHGKINNAHNVEELNKVIMEAKVNPLLAKKSDLITYLSHCAMIVETAKERVREYGPLQGEKRQYR